MFRKLGVLTLAGSVLLFACGSDPENGNLSEPLAMCGVDVDGPSDDDGATPTESESMAENEFAGRLAPTAQTGPTLLSVAAVPSSLVLDGIRPKPVAIVVSNLGSTAITDLKVAVTPPAAATWESDVDDTSSSVNGETGPLIVPGVFTGRVVDGGVTSIVVTGTAGGNSVLSTASITHSKAGSLAAVSSSGGDELTNDRDLHLSIQIDNNSDEQMSVGALVPPTQLGRSVEVASIACPATTIDPYRTDFVDLVIHGSELPSTSGELKVELALTVGDATEYRFVSHRFSTSTFSDESLFSLLGVTSLLLIPGLAALTTWFAARARYRRRRRVDSPVFPSLRNLAHVFAVVGLSAVAIELYRRLGQGSLYDGYGVTSLLAVTLGAVVVSGAVGLGWSYILDKMFPVLDSSNDAEAVLKSLRHWHMPTVTHDGGKYLVLWRHDGAACLVPPVRVASRHTQDEAEEQDLRGLRRKALDDAEAEIGFDPPDTTLRPLTIAAPATFAPEGSAESVVPE